MLLWWWWVVVPNGNSTSKSWLFLLGLYRRKKQITFMTYPPTFHVCPSTFFFAVLLLVYILSTDALSIICSTSSSSVNIYSIICIGALANIVYIPHSDVERLRLEKWCNIYKFALKYSRSTHGRKKQMNSGPVLRQRKVEEGWLESEQSYPQSRIEILGKRGIFCRIKFNYERRRRLSILWLFSPSTHTTCCSACLPACPT